jgi:hypothetical protein
MIRYMLRYRYRQLRILEDLAKGSKVFTANAVWVNGYTSQINRSQKRLQYGYLVFL